MKKSLSHLLLLLWLSLPSQAAETVRVGMIPFPPFIEQQHPGAPLTGLAVQLLRLMNNYQDRYHFISIAISAPRKQHDFNNGIYDMMLFDNINWGWSDYPVNASKVMLSGDGEVFIALAKPGRGQQYFADLSNKSLIGIQGYHYRFANFNADPRYLKQQFNMQLTYNHPSSLKMLLKQRGDIAVLTKSYLLRYLQQHPELRSQLLISDSLDQAYHHRIILRQGIHPSIDEINQMLDGMRQQGLLQQLWQSQGVGGLGAK